MGGSSAIGGEAAGEVALALGARAGEDTFGVDLGGAAVESRVAGMVPAGDRVAAVVVVGGTMAESQGGDGVGADGQEAQDRTSRSKGSIKLEVGHKRSPFRLFFGPVQRTFGLNRTLPNCVLPLTSTSLPERRWPRPTTSASPASPPPSRASAHGALKQCYSNFLVTLTSAPCP